jgi:hypothetical protein
MSHSNIRFEQPYRPEVGLGRPAAARERSDRASALIVMGLSLACTVMAMLDLLLLASGS